MLDKGMESSILKPAEPLENRSSSLDAQTRGRLFDEVASSDSERKTGSTSRDSSNFNPSTILNRSNPGDLSGSTSGKENPLPNLSLSGSDFDNTQALRKNLEDPNLSMTDFLKKLNESTPMKSVHDTDTTSDGGPDLMHMSLNDLEKYFKENPPAKSDSIDYSKLMGDDKVMLTGDLTHGHLDPTELGKIASEIKTKNPSEKIKVGLELFSSDLNDDFKKYAASNADGTYTDPQGKTDVDAAGKPIDYKSKVLDDIKAVADSSLFPDKSEATDKEKWVDGMMSSFEAMKKAGITVEGLEPAVPHIWTDNSGIEKGWGFPTDAIKTLLDDKQPLTDKGPYQGKTTGDLWKDFMSSKSDAATTEMTKYLESHKWMTEPDANGKLVAVDPTKKSADMVMETLTKMRDLGFFKDGIPLDDNKAVDTDKLGTVINSFRSESMAGSIEKSVEDGSRMIASMGSGHIGYNPNNGITTVSTILKDKGIDSAALAFGDPKDTDYFEVQQDHWGKVIEEDKDNPDKVKQDQAYEKEALFEGVLSDASPYDETAVRLASAAKKAGVSDFTLQLHSATRSFDYFVELPAD